MQHVHMAPPHMALAYQLGGMTLAAAPPRGPPAAPGPPHLQPPAAPMGPGLMLGPAPMLANGYAQAAPPGYAQQAGGVAVVIGTDSRTVKVRGLPFRATPVDILSFFEGYGSIADSLQLGVDALGRPSGEAWLTFGSGEEALRAVRERNRHYLGNRYLELSLT